ncbi:GNAT family N-acetyltransferase [Halobacteriovorax sp. JY17]|uniref:GNAT family N-acetyltransferase n=1 Tax=Halobacteriovorax sp. JY17 TaxID=2014617 RepID=UPI000C40605A|nr:GNAT family N-acetyltransferase [Halobacteriovorax sp. JY17]PIK16343.1 MAG: GNAT family N-acetyltransferase [Halobacteriovorax sp. JY17]
MNVEQANKDDHLNTIAKFQVAMARETEELELDLDIVLKGVASVFDDSSKGKYFVALNDKRECIASLLTVNEWSDWRCKNVLWIHSVFVIKEMRGKKIFKEMYQYLQEHVRDDENLAGLRLYVDKRNLSAQEVYKKIGMTKEHYDLFEWLE